MRILLVIPSITNYFTFLDELTAELLEKGHTVALAASDQHFNAVDCYATKPRCEFFPIDLPQAMSPFAHLKAARSLRRVVEEFDADIVHCHTAAGIFTTSLVARAQKSGSVKFVATHHGMVYPLISGFRRKLIGAAERWALRQLDSVHLLNKSDQNELAAKGIIEGIHLYQKSKGIGCRIDQFERVKVSAHVSEKIRQQFAISEDHFVFIYVGRQVWFKGFDITIRAFFRIAEAHGNAKLLLLGAPYRVHPTGLTDAETEHLNTHPQIHRVGWVQEVEHYLSVAHMNLFPSEREGMPVNLMESICMGVPVITRDSRGCNEIVEHEKSGYLMQNRRVEEMEQYMKKAIEDRAMLMKMSEYCLKIRGRFDRMLWIDEQIAYYREICGGD